MGGVLSTAHDTLEDYASTYLTPICGRGEPKITGFVANGFESVREMFENNFEKGREDNAQLCIYYKGECVVDLCGTYNSTFNADSLIHIFSSSKSLTSIVVALLVDRGHLQYNQKISEIWPEFGTGDKEFATVADLMRHEIGLPSFNTPLKGEDLVPENLKKNKIGKIIEQERLKFSPGSMREYHFFTRGWIANEVVRRADPQGRTIGEILREDIVEVLQADTYIGLPSHLTERAIDLTVRGLADVVYKGIMGSEGDPTLQELVTSTFMITLSMFKSKEASPPPPFENIPLVRFDRLVQFFNTRRDVEVPSANANCSARGLAKVAAAMAGRGKLNGTKILSSEGWKALHSKPTRKTIFGTMPTRFTQGGVNIVGVEGTGPENEKEARLHNLIKSLTGFVGWLGLGGSIFQWHPRREIGFAYIPTVVDWSDLTNSKGMRLQQCAVKCIEALDGEGRLSDSVMSSEEN